MNKYSIFIIFIISIIYNLDPIHQLNDDGLLWQLRMLHEKPFHSRFWKQESLKANRGLRLIDRCIHN